MSQGTLERDIMNPADGSGGGGLVRAAVRVLVLSLVVTALVAGIYLLVYDRDGSSDPLATAGGDPAGPAPTQQATENAGETPTPAEPTFAERVAAAVQDLPRNADRGERRDALIEFAEDVVGVEIKKKHSPATAASQACDLLDDGTKPGKLISEFARGSGYTAEQSKAFLLGATTLYCSKHAKDFAFES